MFRTLKIVFLTLAMWLSAAQAQTPEFMHCYLHEAPADAPVSTSQNVSGMLFLVQVASLRHACGFDTSKDEMALANRVSDGGCSASSEIAEFAAETFDLNAETERQALLEEAGGDSDLIDSLCKAVELCVPGRAGYDDECEARLESVMSN